MPKITALSNIKHNGKDYKEGDAFDVDKSDADYLIKLGAAKASGKSSAKSTEPEAPEAPESEAAPAAPEAPAA